MTSNARRRWGSVRLLASGRWQVRYRDASGQMHTASTFATKSDAARQLSLIESEMVRGAWHDPRLGKITFGEWAERWQEGTVNLRHSTRVRDEQYLRTKILPTFGKVEIGDIDFLMVRAWVASLTARGLAPATVVKAAQILRKIMATAVDAGLIASSPVDRVKLPRIEEAEMRFLSPSEVTMLAEAMDPRYSALVLLGAYGGLRAGELFGLRGRCVDAQRARVEVVEIVVDVHGTLVYGPPKTRAGRRSVPLPRSVADALAEHLERYKVASDDLAFRAPEGGTVRLGSWRQRFWFPAVRGAGLERLRVHDLRHTAVALWIAAGASPKEIAARAGHTSVSTVLDRYGHLLPGTEEKVNDALDAFIRASRSPSRGEAALS